MARTSKNEKIPKKVVNKEPRKQKVKSKKTSPSSGFYYSFLTAILFLCLIQVAISAVLNVSKGISFVAKIDQMTKTRDAAKALNEQLKDNINNFSNVAGLEAIARNNLKMSSEDEVLVIINTAKEEIKKEEEKKRSFIKLD